MMTKAYSVCERITLQDQLRKKLNKTWFTNKFFKPVPYYYCISFINEKWKGFCLVSVLSRNDNQLLLPTTNKRIQRSITEAVPSQPLSLSTKGIWLNMKWIFEIRAISCPNNYCIKTTVILVEGWQMKYLADDSLSILQLFCCYTFLPLFLALIKMNSRMLTQASKVQFPPYIMCLTLKKDIFSNGLLHQYWSLYFLWIYPQKSHLLSLAHFKGFTYFSLSCPYFYNFLLWSFFLNKNLKSVYLKKGNPHNMSTLSSKLEYPYFCYKT